MTTANLDAADLAAVAVDGLIREDVMNRIWDISAIPLPFSDMVGSGTVGNSRFSWTQDELGSPAIDGQVIDGSDTDTQNDTATGARVQNFTEERVKVVQVSSRADASNTIGRSTELAYQIMRRQQELRRDVEATALSNNSSVAGDGSTTASRTGALNAWIESNLSVGATGSAGGFNTSTGLVDAYSPGTARALSETVFKDVLQAVYEQGGESPVIMARPAVVRLFSEYQFTSGARVATMTKDNQGATGPGTSLGAVNVYISDWGTCQIRSNRLQPAVAADVSTMYILDPSLIELVYLRGYQTEPLAKTGLSSKAQMSVDWGLRVGNEKGLGAIADIDETEAMVA